MKKYLNNTICFFLFFFTFLFSNAQDIAISGACFDGIQTLVFEGDPTITSYNGKPVYYNAAANASYQGNPENPEVYLSYQLASDIGTAENRWVVQLDGQPYFYHISDAETPAAAEYLPFSTPSDCDGSITVAAICNTPAPIIDVITVLFSDGRCLDSGFYNSTEMRTGKNKYVKDDRFEISFNGNEWYLNLYDNLGLPTNMFINTNIPAGFAPPLTGWVPTACDPSDTMEIQLGVNLCDGATVADLSTITTGANLKFYDVATSGAVLNPADVLVAGDYYVSNTGNGCESDRTTFSVSLNPLPTVAFTAPADLCIDAGAQSGLGGGTSISRWKLDGVSFDDGGVATGTLEYDEVNNTFINWSISVSGGNTDDLPPITYSPSNSVIDVSANQLKLRFNSSRIFQISISVPFTAARGTVPFNLSEDPDGNVECFNCYPFRLVNDGNFIVTSELGVYSGPGVIDDGNGTGYSFDALVAEVGVHTITYTTTNANGCTSSASDDVEVFAVDVASFSYSAAAYPNNVADPTPTIVGVTGGIFSSHEDLVIDRATGVVDLSASIPNVTYDVIYTTAGACPSVSSTSIKINALNDSNFKRAIDVCLGTNPVDGKCIGSPYGEMPDWDVSAVTAMNRAFVESAFNADISSWDVSNVTNMSAMFASAVNFNADIKDWNMNSVTDMSLMFSTSNKFNRDISLWDVSSVTNMYAMFDGASSFNQNIGSWDVSKVTNMYNIFVGASLSTANYDALLNGWSKLVLQSGVSFSGNSKYCAGADARATIKKDFGWTISDGGVLNLPTVVTKDITVELNALGSVSIVVADVNNGSTGTCGTPIFTLSHETFTCSNIGENTVTLTATDASGNTSSATAIATVVDNISPSITLNGAAAVTHDAYTDYTDSGATTADNCSATLVTIGSVDSNIPADYSITYTARDASGNISSSTRIVTVVDKTPPVARATDKEVTLDSSGNASITPEEVGNGSTDDSGVEPTYTLSKTTFDCSNIGANAVTLTAIDVNGNTSSATAVVTVIDANAATVTFTAPTDLCIGAGKQRSLSGGLPSGGVYSGTGVTDDRNGSTYSFNPATAGDGTHSIRYTFTNASGCAASASDDVAVLEPAGPVVDVITVIVDGGCGSYAGFYNATSMLNDKKSYVSTTDAGNVISYNGSKWVLQQAGGSRFVLFENSTVSADVTPPLTGWIATRYCSRSSMEVGLGVNFTSTARAEDLARVTTGTNLRFYDVAIGGTPLRSAERLTKTVYYVSDTDTATGCESKRTEFTVNIEDGGGRTRTRTRNTKFASSADKTALDTEGFESKVLFSMYSNPSAENVTLSSSMDGDFTIFNLVGQVVKTFTVKANLETVVYVGDLSAGTYVVKPTNSSSISSQKLIIRK